MNGKQPYVAHCKLLYSLCNENRQPKAQADPLSLQVIDTPLSFRSMNSIGILFLFVIYFLGIERVCSQNMLELIKSKNGEKNYPARKNREREDSDDFLKEIAPLQAPRR